MSDSASSVRRHQNRFFYFRTSSTASFKPQEVLDAKNVRTEKTPGPYRRKEFLEWNYGFAAVGSGFPDDQGVPVIKFKKNPKLPLRDFEGYGSYKVVSGRALSILSRHAPGAIDYRKANVFWCDRKSEESVDYWVCDVIRFENAVDHECSRLSPGGQPSRLNNYTETGSRIVFRDDIADDVHLFRLLELPTSVFCSKTLAIALKEAGCTGVTFKDPFLLETPRLRVAARGAAATS